MMLWRSLALCMLCSDFLARNGKSRGVYGDSSLSLHGNKVTLIIFYDRGVLHRAKMTIDKRKKRDFELFLFSLRHSIWHFFLSNSIPIIKYFTRKKWLQMLSFIFFRPPILNDPCWDEYIFEGFLVSHKAATSKVLLAFKYSTYLNHICQIFWNTTHFLQLKWHCVV